jgi:uncharacterized protein YraI
MMIQVLWHKLKLWKSLVSGIVPVALLLVVTYNTAATPAVQQNPQRNPPPEIIGFTLCPSDSPFPGAIIRIQVNVRRNGHRIDNFHWLVETGEGVITDGNGTSQIIYQAPKTPGIYPINVELEYEGTERVRGSATIKVPPPTPTPKAVVVYESGLNLRSGPGTNYDIIGYLRNGDILDVKGRVASNDWIQVIPGNSNSLAWVSASSKYVQINVDLDSIPIVEAPPISVLPTSPEPPSQPSLDGYSAPVLTAPDNGLDVNGTFPPLDWYWDGELGENEYFEVRVWHENIKTYHPALGWVKVPHFDYNITQELQGKYYWTVLVVEGKDARTKDWWKPEAFPYPVWDGEPVRDLSPEGEIRFFFYLPPPDICTNCVNPGPISEPCDEPPC